MYTNKNKALTFLEGLIAITILIVISSSTLTFIKPISKTFYIINNIQKREESIFSFRQLIVNHLLWNKNSEIRILNINSSTNLPSFSNIFSMPSEEKGNLLIIKFHFYNKAEKKLENKYRCFFFLDNNGNLNKSKEKVLGESLQEANLIFKQQDLLILKIGGTLAEVKNFFKDGRILIIVQEPQKEAIKIFECENFFL